MANREILNVPMTSELMRIEMEQTEGGAFDAFLKIGGVKGESRDKFQGAQTERPGGIVFVGGWGSSAYQY
jgi:hypothetical protein